MISQPASSHSPGNSVRIQPTRKVVKFLSMHKNTIRNKKATATKILTVYLQFLGLVSDNRINPLTFAVNVLGGVVK